MISSELLPLNVAGEWRLGGGDVYESLYPATGEPIARLGRPAWPMSTRPSNAPTTPS